MGIEVWRKGRGGLTGCSRCAHVEAWREKNMGEGRKEGSLEAEIWIYYVALRENFFRSVMVWKRGK